MAKIIKLNLNTNLGKILGQIEMTPESDIVLEVSKEVEDSGIIENIKLYASRIQKTITIKNTDSFGKIGFVSGEDVSTNPITIINVTPKPKFKFSFKKPNIAPDLFSKTAKVFTGNKLPFLIIPAVLSIFLGIFLYLLYYQFHKANVFIKIESQVFTASKNVFVQAVKEENNDLAVNGKTVTKTLTEKAEGVPSGEKEIGENATGAIKIFNKTEKETTIKLGTEVTIKNGNSDLIFVTEKEVKIPAKTTQEIEDEGEIKKADVFGSAIINIIATNFGETYNLNKSSIDEKDISVKNLKSSEFAYEMESNTKGGTSKKVTAVIQKDIDQLVEDLEKRLQKKLAEALKNEVSSTEKVLEGGVNITYSLPVVNAKVGDEVEKLEVSLTGNADTLSFNKQELKDTIVATIIKDLPSEYTANEDNFEIFETVKSVDLNPTTKKVSSLTLAVKVENKIVAKSNTDKIKEDLEGISFKEATDYLSKIDNISDIKIIQSPNIPFLVKNMPKNKNNIKVEIQVVK